MWVNHVDLGKWSDAMVIAPCTANTLAKMNRGFCDNLLLATYLSADCPVFFAPAMDLDMYSHPSTKRNIRELISKRNIELPSGTGELASGLIGKGRMCEPEEILNMVSNHFEIGSSLLGKKILVNAGPTFEKLDPVRFVGNYSSGKMGKAIANKLAERGATVSLVLGPVSTDGIHPSVKLTQIESAQEMHRACDTIYKQSDAAVLSAAVADYKPANQAKQKIKKTADSYALDLVKTVDVLKSLGTAKRDNQILVGFALETENELENASGKLHKKNLDFIVLNSMNDKNAGFGKDTNRVTIIEKSGKTTNFTTKTKLGVAEDIVNLLTTYL